MEILGAILGGELNEVAASVALGVRGVNSGGGVEWLMDVSDVVDEEADGV
jgi:hypothetical protein